MLSGLTTIAYLNGDTLVMKLCLWGIGASLGFMLLNYPLDAFFGDGGAYLTSFWLAECGVLLLKNEILPYPTWAVLFICILPSMGNSFPFTDATSFTKVKIGMPDDAFTPLTIQSSRAKT